MPEESSSRIQFGDQALPIADLLAKYRPYLKLLARRQLDGMLAARLSASDVVQQTQLEAFRDCGLFRGDTEEQFVAWLKAILQNNVAQATRTHVIAKKRSLKQEQAPVDGGRSMAEQFVGGEDSPSAAAMLGESAVTLARAMEKLTEEQYEAIRLRYIEGHSLATIGATMDRSHSAVAGLIKRGLRGLRATLSSENGT